METIELTADFLVDIDETGAVCGIELLNARDQLARGDDGKLIVVNAMSGGQTVLDVARSRPMRQLGRVGIPQKALISALKMDGWGSLLRLDTIALPAASAELDAFGC